MGLYDRYLALRIRAADADPPAHVALVITERDLLEPGAYDTLEDFLEWAFAYGADRVAVYVSVLDPEAIEPLQRGLAAIDAPAPVAIHGPDATEAVDGRAEQADVETATAAPAGAVGQESSPAGAATDEGDGGTPPSRAPPNDGAEDEPPIQISVGLGGKHEFTEAVRSLAAEAAAGDLDPEEIEESDVEAELVVPTEPDLVIKTGAERLSDFMIWQSVYSELYFTDVNWRDLRKRDYLRAIREYIDRTRRFGK